MQRKKFIQLLEVTAPGITSYTLIGTPNAQQKKVYAALVKKLQLVEIEKMTTVESKTYQNQSSLVHLARKNNGKGKKTTMTVTVINTNKTALTELATKITTIIDGM